MKTASFQGRTITVENLIPHSRAQMVKKLSEFQTLTAKATTVSPKLTALNVELAQVEDEIEKLLNTLTGANTVLLSYANGKIEELDTNRQRLIKEIAALNAETISPQKIEFLSVHPENWDSIDFEDGRQVTGIILSQAHATSDRGRKSENFFSFRFILWSVCPC